MRRRDTLAEGRSTLGSFAAAPGEYVYIGNFAVDCYKTPIPWRFYTQGKADFADHMAQFKAKYPALPIDKVTYRLFSTIELGEPYELK
ncbi:hypothetical protein AACH06_24060 [Ideonella sp. DXS29W]|uniref:Uncharacterized protein n=1 Tax=Ideonella lacteola TaxID=2984193 RepID=A0ABU9BVC5_9BURK